MDHKILGLHHVTATVDDAQQDLDFFRGVLGLRLVKRTVNFDNHNVFHFYYGNEHGSPGTIWTTFPYGGWGVPVGTKGAGQIGATSFAVPIGTLDAWRVRLADKGIAVGDGPSRFGDASILFDDPSGLSVELVASDRDERAPWIADGIDPEMAIRGLHSVTMSVRVPDASVRFMTEVLGFKVVNEMDGRIRLAVNGDEPGKTIEIAHDVHAPRSRNGLGTVHHVAMAIATGEEQRRLQQDLWNLGYQVTDVLDRQYFTSIYFREPGGILFEVATVPPGFLIDEDAAHLGESLKLPPWEEANRREIEAGLPKVTS
jgi:glyoxalase family protein